MPKLDRLEKIHDGTRSVVYRGLWGEEGRPVVVKVLRGPYPSLERQARFRREFEIGRALHGPNVVEMLELEARDDTLAIVMEDSGGEALAGSGRLSLSEFLPLAAEIAAGLARIHAGGVIHKDLNPSNVVFTRATGVVKIIDFGISRTSGEAPLRSAQATPALEGTLAYMSPEQTGRTNRAVDHRSDLYSLGATFYELLTGQQPFLSEDPLELVHAQLARVPAPPHAVEASVPPALSALVLKLLEKNPDDRYQSALGVKADLDEFCARFAAAGRISSFPLAAKDAPERLELPRGLYGRDSELDQLFAAFERAAAGAFELLLVSGQAGVGKTRLVEELRARALARGAYFVSGKFEQFRRDVPYASLSDALGQLMRYILAESDEVIGQWRERLLAAAGDNGRIIIDIVPELEHVIGAQPPVPELPPTEAENRFHFTLRRFVRALGDEAHPQVLFLDDLQWADLPSIRLLEPLAADPGTHHLLIVCGYRDNEVAPTHPFALALDSIRQTGTPVRGIRLGDLEFAEVQRFVTDALRAPAEELERLAALCFEKTRGNPFFLSQFLTGLCDAGLVQVGPDRSCSVDMVEIERRKITDNVVDFLVERIRRVSPATQATLQTAACIGGAFDVATVSTLRGCELASIEADLSEALAEGFIQQLEERRSPRSAAEPGAARYTFVHDRLEQAAWSMVPDERRTRISLELSRLLSSKVPEERHERIFEIASHLNRASALLESLAEKDECVEVNLEAGRRARRSAAYAPALAYFEAGLNLSDEACWTRCTRRTLELHLAAAESAFLAGDYARMDALLESVLTHDRSLLGTARAREIRVHALNAQNDLLGAVRAGLDALRPFGVKLPENPGQLTLLGHLGRTKLRLAAKSQELLSAVQNTSDPEVLAAMRLLIGIAPAAYYARPNLLPLIAFEMVTLSAERGISPQSAYAFAVYGLVLCSLGDLEGGSMYGRLALRYAERFDDPYNRARATHLYNAHIRFWKAPIRESIAPLLGTFQTALTNGDLEFAAFSAFMHCNMALQAGRALAELKLDMEHFAAEILGAKQETTRATHAIGHQAVLNLLGEGTGDPCLLQGVAYDETRMVRVHQQRNDRTNLFVYHAVKLLLAAFFRRFDTGSRLADESGVYSDGGVSTVYVPASLFYGALVRLGSSSQKERGRNRRLATAQLKKLRRFAKHEPNCNRHRVLLLEAELARLAGDGTTATARYEAALSAAHASGMQHEEALSAEWAGRYFQTLGNATVGRAYLARARFLYERWGATAKVTELDRDFPDLVASTQASAGPPSSTWTRTGFSAAGNLDLLSVIKASQALSGEIELSRVMSRLMMLAVENAGATRGLLMVERDGRLLIVAELSALDSTPVLSEAEPAMSSGKVPTSVLNYVVRTQKPLVLDDPAQSGPFTRDAYVTARRPRAILSVPLVSQGRMKGLLYLENQATPSAFTADRIEVLKLLSTQAAISLENAGLYSDLKSALAEQVRLTEAHKRFVPQEFLHSLGRRSIVDVTLGDSVQKEMSILFSDMRDFTTLLEKLPPEENIRFINRYLAHMEPPILKNGGFVEGYIGDAIMALFEAGAESAVRAGTDMLRGLAELNRARALAGESPCRIGVGINTGILTLGAIGASARIKCGVLGDSVNLAARVESITKAYGVALLISDETYRRLPEPTTHAIRLVDRVRVVGRERPVTLYEVFDADEGSLRERKLSIADDYRDALEAYSAGDFSLALDRLERCLTTLPSDRVLLHHRSRCLRYREQPPTSDWDGVTSLSSK